MMSVLYGVAQLDTLNILRFVFNLSIKIAFDCRGFERKWAERSGRRPTGQNSRFQQWQSDLFVNKSHQSTTVCRARWALTMMCVFCQRISMWLIVRVQDFGLNINFRAKTIAMATQFYLKFVWRG
jgi:hypothetical protein